jgi:heme exporter protein D
MSLHINSMDELETLLTNTNIEIADVDQLRELLRTINQDDLSPEARQEELKAQEGRHQRQLAHQEKLRTLEHTETMRALDIGHVPVDPVVTGELADVARRAIGTAGWMGVLVPFCLFGAAVGTTYFVQQQFNISPEFLALMGMVWGTTTLVSLLAVILAILTVRKKTSVLIDILRLSGRKGNLPALSTSDSKPEPVVETSVNGT